MRIPIKTTFLFFVLFILLAWYYGVFSTMNRGPYSAHQWRQADCLSITQHYYQDDLPFLEPEVHWRGTGASGKAMSEFPLMYYSVAKMWQLFGKHYWIYRLLSFTICTLGFIYLFKLCQRIFGNDFWSLLIPLFVFTSPIIAYYSNNFLMNSNALAFVFIGAYHQYRYFAEGKRKHLYFGSVFFLLAGLLKITALLLFVAFGAVLMVRVFMEKRRFKQFAKELLSFVVVILCIMAWYSYSAYYNKHSGMAPIFLQGILPIWNLSFAEIGNVWSDFRRVVLPEFLNVPILIILFACFGFVLFNLRKLNRYMGIFLLLSTLGIVLYFLLFFQVFNAHDYYLTNLLVLIPMILLSGMYLLKTHYAKVYGSFWLKIIGVFVFLVSAYYCRVHTVIKYDVGSSSIRDSIFTTSERKLNWQIYHWGYNRSYKDLETIEPYLDSLGIKKNDLVVSVPDPTINITLYLMNRNGFTDYGYPEYVGEERIEKAIEWGANYLIVNSDEALNIPYLQPYLQHKIGERGFVHIYALK